VPNFQLSLEEQNDTVILSNQKNLNEESGDALFQMRLYFF